MITYRKTVNFTSDSLRRYRLLRLSAWALALAYALGTVIDWLALPLHWQGAQFDFSLQAHLRQAAGPAGASLGFCVLGMLVALPAIVCFGRAVRALDGLTRHFERGDYFVPGAITQLDLCIQGLFWGLLLSQAESFVLPLLASLLGLRGAPQLVLHFELEPAAIWAVLVCAILRLSIRAMLEGARLQEENSEFI